VISAIQAKGHFWDPRVGVPNRLSDAIAGYWIVSVYSNRRFSLENMLTLSQFIADAGRTSALVTEWSQNWGHSAKLSY